MFSQVKDLAMNLAGHASDLLRESIARQSTRSAADLSDLASGLRSSAKQLGENPAAPLLEKTADRLEDVSKLLDEPDLTALGRSVGRIANEKPWLFVGGAVAAGIACGRFLKDALDNARQKENEP
jgi:hypothetical protein